MAVRRLVGRDGRRRPQRPRLQPFDGPRHGLAIDARQRRRDRPLRAHVGARRAHEFDHIVRQQEVGGGHLAEAEVDDPHLAVVGDEHVGEPQVAVRDAVASEVGDRRPDRCEHLIGDLLRVELVERLAVDGVVGGHERVRLGRRHGAQARRADLEVACGQGEQRFVFDRPSQRGERPLVAEVPPLQAPVDAEQEVGAAFVASEHLDEEPAAATARRRKSAGDRT